MSHKTQRQLAMDLCTKSGQSGTYRTAAMVIRRLIKNHGTPTLDQWNIVATSLEQKADELDQEVLKYVPVDGGD